MAARDAKRKAMSRATLVCALLTCSYECNLLVVFEKLVRIVLDHLAVLG